MGAAKSLLTQDAVSIRAASPDDRPALVAFMAELQAHERAMAEDLADPREMAEPHFTALESWAERNDGGVLVAELDGSLAGFCVFGIEEDFGYYVQPQFKRVGCVSDLYVEPHHREHGVGARLLIAAEAQLIERGVKRVEITTLFENIEARGFYEARGYRPFQAQYAKNV